MIRYTLKCNKGHQFDSWFSDSESFEQLKNNGHLECAICSSKEVEKSLMVPRINSGSDEEQKTLISAQSALEKEIKALKNRIKKTVLALPSALKVSFFLLILLLKLSHLI